MNEHVCDIAAQKRGHGSAGKRGREGVALLVALLFIVLLAVIVVEFSFEVSVDASLLEAGDTDLDAYIAARSAVAMGLSLLSQDLQNANTQTRNPGDKSNDAQIDSEQDVWFTRGEDSAPSYQEINDGVMMWNVDDEYGKLNINAFIQQTDNSADPRQEALRAAFVVFFELRGAEDPEGLVDCIIDWIDGPNNGDPDDQTRSKGAESDYYASLPVPYVCKNKPMDSIEELLLVKGMTSALYFGDPSTTDPDTGEPQQPLSEYLTVHGHRKGYVNINTARREVLAALAGGVGQDGQAPDVAAIITARQQDPFENIKNIEDRNMMIYAPPVVDPKVPPGKGSPLLVVASRVFRIQGDGYAGNTQVRIEAYVRRRGDQNQQNQQQSVFTILDWRVIR